MIPIEQLNIDIKKDNIIEGIGLQRNHTRMQERQAWGATRLLRPVCSSLVCFRLPLAQQ